MATVQFHGLGRLVSTEAAMQWHTCAMVALCVGTHGGNAGMCEAIGFYPSLTIRTNLLRVTRTEQHLRSNPKVWIGCFLAWIIAGTVRKATLMDHTLHGSEQYGFEFIRGKIEIEKI